MSSGWCFWIQRPELGRFMRFQGKRMPSRAHWGNSRAKSSGFFYLGAFCGFSMVWAPFGGQVIVFHLMFPKYVCPLICRGTPTAPTGQTQSQTIDFEDQTLMLSPIHLSPPPPALETSLLDELIEEESDLAHTIEDDIISVDASSITAHIRNLISKDSTDVVWSEDGSEVVVHTSSLSVEIGDGSLIASIEMSCDQCPRSAIIASFFLGKSDNSVV